MEPVYCSMFSSNCCFLTCTQVSQEAGKVLWYFHLLKNFPQFVVIYTVKGFSIEAEVDAFLESPCFLYDPMNADNLISGSSAFSKSSLYMRKFLVHILLKPSLKDFEHNLNSMLNECNCLVVWQKFPSLGLKWKLIQSCGHWQVFQICWFIECCTLTASSNLLHFSSFQ